MKRLSGNVSVERVSLGYARTCGLKSFIPTVRLGRANNAVSKHVRHMSHAIDWNFFILVYKSGVESHSIALETALVRKVPNFNNTQNTLGVGNLSFNLILISYLTIPKCRVFNDVGGNSSPIFSPLCQPDHLSNASAPQ